MSDWSWIDREFALAAHSLQIAAHGGGQGVRDVGLLESALARPVNLSAYGQPDVAGLAASYAFGLARNHPFVDGNKRTALVVCETFVEDNGSVVNATNAELAVLIEELAAGHVSEDELAAWLRERISASSATSRR
ncbi:MAG: type II toxin-antitoxin system death-on-curing family toxin [Sphingomicrobium sp.]|nr:type II toxin-antitoxin system death-on-curing family toxin [Sphingomonadales bacterium]